MKAVCDDKIPYIREALDDLFDQVCYLPGAEISPKDVTDADALIVRTRTHCDASLLSGSRVGFVATATIGFDHLDTTFLQRAGTRWMNCPGCNARSVAQYVQSSLFRLESEGRLSLSRATLGIVGVGHVGEWVRRAMEPFVKRILLNDPPRQAEGGFVGMDTLAEEADILTFHTPLTADGPFPTVHLLDGNLLSTLRRRPVIVNSSRGAVVDNRALVAALDEGRVSACVVDTWEDEPHIHAPLLQRAAIATPHIAGYSADGKANASRMVVEGLCRWLHRPMKYTILPPDLPYIIEPSDDPRLRALQYYDPADDTRRLKAHPEQFERFRGDYSLRREPQEDLILLN